MAQSTYAKREICRHCGIRVAWRARGLCNLCYPQFKDLYPPKKQYHGNSSSPPSLPILDNYPDPALLPICQHGKQDGECAICEQAQRKTLIISDSNSNNNIDLD